MADINPDMRDMTNVPNPHQQQLRYGLFDAQAVLARVRADAEAARLVLPEARTAILVTHLNETDGELTGGAGLADFTAHFDRVYLSDQPWEVWTQNISK